MGKKAGFALRNVKSVRDDDSIIDYMKLGDDVSGDRATKHLYYLGWKWYTLGPYEYWRAPVVGGIYDSLISACVAAYETAKKGEEEEEYEDMTRDSIDGDEDKHEAGTSESVEPKVPKNVVSLLILRGCVKNKADFVYKDVKGVVVGKGKLMHDGLKCNCCDSYFCMRDFEYHVCGRELASSFYINDGKKSLSDCFGQAVNLDAGNEKRLDRVALCLVCGEGPPLQDLVLCCQCNWYFHRGCVSVKSLEEANMLEEEEDMQGEGEEVKLVCGFCTCRVCGGPGNSHDSGLCEVCGMSRYHHICCGSKTTVVCHGCCARILLGLTDILGKSFPVSHAIWWSLLKKNTGSAIYETNCKLQLAAHVLLKEFSVDLSRLVFSSNCSIQCINYSRCCTVLLENATEIISVAIIRLFGSFACEVIYVATRECFKRQGWGRILMDRLEMELQKVGVDRVVIPSASSAEEFWVKVGYEEMSQEDKDKFNAYPHRHFVGVTLMQKFLASRH